MSQLQHSSSQQSPQYGTAQSSQTESGMQGAGGQGGSQQLVGRQFPTSNHLPQQVRTTSVSVLNQALADAVVLQSQLKAAHWNVKGLHFAQLHELFGDIADRLEDHIDEIAERATALGGEALGTVPIAARNATLPPMPSGVSDGYQLLSLIAERLAAFDSSLYRQMEAIERQEDLDTIDLLNEVSRDVSKSLWFVESHLQATQAQGGQAQQQQQMTVQGGAGVQ